MLSLHYEIKIGSLPKTEAQLLKDLVAIDRHSKALDSNTDLVMSICRRLGVFRKRKTAGKSSDEEDE